MSGRHPMKSGITHTILERERMALSTVTLPQILKNVGYVSGIFASGISAMKKSINLIIVDLMKPLYMERGALDKNSTAPVQMSLK